MKRILFYFLFFTLCFAAHAADVKLPLFGRVMDAEDNPIEGAGFFKVLICEDDGDVVYSTTGTETVCEEPDDAIAIDDIINGYYNFSLGDTDSFADMEPMTVSMVSSDVDRLVHIWFSTLEDGPFESLGTLQMVSTPSASNTDYFGGLALDQFLRVDSTISTTVIDGTLPASQVEGFSDDARDLTLGDSVASETVAIKANTTVTEDKPAIRYEATLGQWQVSNNGTDFSAIATATDGLVDDSVTSAKILNSTVSVDDLATSSVASDEIVDGTVAAIDLASDSVEASEVAVNAISASEIVSSGVTAGTYTIATVTVDEDGRVTSAVNGSVSETGDISSIGDATTGDAFIDGTNNGTKLIYEGTSVDDFENVLSFFGDPTADTIVTVPNTTGTLVTTGDNNTVTGGMIDESTLILTGLIDDDGLAVDAVDGGTGGEIADNTVTAADLASDSVEASEIAANAVSASEIVSSGVTAGTYTIATVTVDEDGRVTSAVNGSVSETGDISSIGDATTGDAFIDGTNNGTKLIYEGSSVDDFENILSFTGDPTADTIVTVPNTTGTLVTTGDLGSVSSTMLASDAVTSAKILDGEIINTDISSSAAIDFSKLATLPSGQVLVGSSLGVASAIAVSGDGTLDSAGALTITDNNIDGTDIQIGSEAQGDVLYYNGTDWTNLTAGTSGQFLKTNGSGSNPSWSAPSTGTDMADFTLSRRWGFALPLTTAATTFTATGISAPTSPSGTATAQPAATGATRLYIRYASAATINTAAGLAGGPFTQTRPLYRPKFSTVILTDSVITSRRIYAGIVESSLVTLATNTTGTTASTIDYVAVGYDTGGTGNVTDWLCCSGDGANSSCSTIGVVVAASTEYTITVDWTTAGTLTCTVNGTSVSKSTNLSTAAVNLGYYNALTTLTAAARNHFVSKFALEQN